VRRNKTKLFLVLLFIFLCKGSLLSAEAPPAEAKITPGQVSGLIDLDVKDVDIKEIARIFSRLSGLNFVVGDNLAAKVTFKAVNVDWETALNMILKTYNLTYAREGNFLRILSYTQLRQEEEGVPLATKVIFLNFAKADDMRSALEAILSNRGRVNTDAKTNSLIITDTPDAIGKMLGIIKDLDKRTPQVMIEAMMVDVKLTAGEQLGINWTVTHKDVPSRYFTQSLSANLSGGIIQYGKTILPHANLLAIIDFWCQNSKAEVLANPKVLTLDGLAAKIELVEQVPYTESQINPTTGGVTTSTGFKDVGIKLDVIPHISSGGFVSLDIKTEQSFQVDTVNNQPIIYSRKAETNLLAADGETIVIGGLKKRNTTFTVTKLPLIGSIPVIGRLFQKRVRSSTDSELLIFVTPYIVTESLLTSKDKEALGKFKEPPSKKEVLKLLKKPPFPLRPPEKSEDK
jgi:type IV pilus assembly protein PilQ